MINPIMLYNKIISMPSDIAEEVNDFADFVLQKKQNNDPSTPVSDKKNIDINLENLPERGFGCMKGMFKMSPDFDEPLEDFKDYM